MRLAVYITACVLALAQAPAAAVLLGTSEGETIIGTSEADWINGRGGADWLSGRGGADTVIGLGANDTLSGGWQTDHLYGGKGNDLLRVAADDHRSDFVDGGPGTDRCIVRGKVTIISCEIIERR